MKLGERIMKLPKKFRFLIFVLILGIVFAIFIPLSNTNTERTLPPEDIYGGAIIVIIFGLLFAGAYSQILDKVIKKHPRLKFFNRIPIKIRLYR